MAIYLRFNILRVFLSTKYRGVKWCLMWLVNVRHTYINTNRKYATKIELRVSLMFYRRLYRRLFPRPSMQSPFGILVKTRVYPSLLVLAVVGMALYLVLCTCLHNWFDDFNKTPIDSLQHTICWILTSFVQRAP